jgi:erythromycin esterase-like protein
MLRELGERNFRCLSEDCDEWLDAAANARLVKNAEAYYRVMYHGAAESWNLRDTHMFETLCNLLDAHGPHSKAVVWAHNSHIGDARFTEMGVLRHELNIGQLCRERFGSEAALIGFGTHTGTVAAAARWDGEMEIKRVRPSRPDSYERLCHDAGVARFLLDLAEENGPALHHRLLAPRLERFIGVIYRPETELQSHYAEASLPRQFDGFVWFDETTAVTPLLTAERRGVPETYPFGL